MSRRRRDVTAIAKEFFATLSFLGAPKGFLWEVCPLQQYAKMFYVSYEHSPEFSIEITAQY